MGLDKNKTCQTHRATATAAAYLDLRGFKPIETEVHEITPDSKPQKLKPRGFTPEEKDKGKVFAQRLVRNNTPGRNEPCPCGSGLKFKKCHGK